MSAVVSFSAGHRKMMGSSRTTATEGDGASMGGQRKSLKLALEFTFGVLH